MPALIFIFAFFAGLGLLGVAFTKDTARKDKNGRVVIDSVGELVTIRKIAVYMFLVFFLLTTLQINTDYGGTQTTTTQYGAYNVIANTIIGNVPSCTSTVCSTVTETSNTLTQYPAYSITTTQNSVGADLSLAIVLVSISYFMLFVYLLSDLITVLLYVAAAINRGR